MLLFFIFLSIIVSSISSNDTQTLTKFMQSADVDGKLATNWSTGNACSGNWTGIKCSPITGRVISLSLPKLDLCGPLDIPSRLDQLCFIDLHSNHLNGTLFHVISSLPHLKVIRLHGNNFSGPILSTMFSNLTHLLTFHAQNNHLSGHVPDLTHILPKLSEFNVSNNQLYGSVPDDMIKKFNMTSFSGNKLPVLTSHLMVVKPSNRSLPNGGGNRSSSGTGDEKRLRKPVIILIAGWSVVLVAVLMLLSISFCFYFAYNSESEVDDILSEEALSKCCQVFSCSFQTASLKKNLQQKYASKPWLM